MLGQIDGRTSADVQAWLAGRSEAFREGVAVVVIDPHAGYSAAVRMALPAAAQNTCQRDRAAGREPEEFVGARRGSAPRARSGRGWGASAVFQAVAQGGHQGEGAQARPADAGAPRRW